MLSRNALGRMASTAEAISGRCFWSAATFDFAGLAKSVQFGSAAGVAGFDNVTVNAVPLPAAGWLLLSALGGFGALRLQQPAATVPAHLSRPFRRCDTGRFLRKLLLHFFGGEDEPDDSQPDDRRGVP